MKRCLNVLADFSSFLFFSFLASRCPCFVIIFSKDQISKINNICLAFVNSYSLHNLPNATNE